VREEDKKDIKNIVRLGNLEALFFYCEDEGIFKELKISYNCVFSN